MAKVEIKSFVKINLSIDVGPRGDNGYHRVDMVMQQLSFHDDVTVEYMPSDPGREGCGTASGDGGSFDIEVSTNRYYLPVDNRNLAYQAAELMVDLVSGGSRDQDGERKGTGSGSDCGIDHEDGCKDPVYVAPGTIRISIRKRIPVAGGLAGGSGNAAAVLHALNIIWGLGLSLSELMDLGAKLGSDVPFCVMGQARSNRKFPEYIRKDAMAVSCARATGRGTELVPVTPLDSWVVISKPKFSVSTKEVYEGIDAREIAKRPDNDRLVSCMNEKAKKSRHRSARPDADLYRDFINVLEEYTLDRYPKVAETKGKMLEAGAKFALMSGSGPTVFGIFGSMSEAKEAAEKLRAEGLETYWTRTAI
ncbi:MAG: hypothetical protein IKF07_00945 [Eubacterium sp.]|nr:hypothetical protein [Eubacterium sp.]